jgi:hypothetical protein
MQSSELSSACSSTLGREATRTFFQTLEASFKRACPSEAPNCVAIGDLLPLQTALVIVEGATGARQCL